MPDWVAYLSIVLGIISLYFIYVFKTPSNFIAYYKSKPGKGSAVGICFALLLVTVALLLSTCAQAEEDSQLKWFQHGAVFVGLDHLKGQSPQCKQGGPNDRLTSNLGFRANILQYGRLDVNGKWTHHSCFVSSDRETYDGVGLEAVWWIW